MSNNDILKVGVIGCGLIGNKRAAVIKNDPTSVLRAASDVNVINAAVSLKQCGAGAGGRACRDWRDMLNEEKLDALIVATPNKYLKKISLWALQRGINVLCEKPLGRNIWESERMVKVAGENGAILKTGFNHRHHPAIFKAHDLVSKGAIGQVYYVRCIYGHGGRPGYEKEWRASKEICGGGEMLDQGVHVVDLFRWFLGDFEEAYGIVPTFYCNMEVEDNALALFRTADGRVAQMHTSWTQWKNRFTFEIFGEAGYLIVEGLGGSYGVEKLIIGKRPVNRDSAPIFSRGSLDGKTGTVPHFPCGKKGRSPSFSGTPIKKGGGGNNQYLGGAPEEETLIFDGPDVSWEMEWKEFTAAIREKREPLGSGRDGLEANRMIAAVYLSAKENRPVKLTEITGDRVTE
ncbi:MAG: Gfo/Idh/MocA family oxidoreductase [Syntrophales bacterium]|nr:Gfo/Idh/MocA family oxidoreductase [Syntrophales bacterium]